MSSQFFFQKENRRNILTSRRSHSTKSYSQVLTSELIYWKKYKRQISSSAEKVNSFKSRNLMQEIVKYPAAMAKKETHLAANSPIGGVLIAWESGQIFGQFRPNHRGNFGPIQELISQFIWTTTLKCFPWSP